MIAMRRTAKPSAAALSAERGLSLIPPYRDHPQVIAGQGTATKELIQEVGPSIGCLCHPEGAGFWPERRWLPRRCHQTAK